MLHRAVALVGLFALFPAHATLIEHSSTPAITNVGGDVYEDSGVGIDEIAREFLFGDSASRTHYPHFWRLQTRGNDRQSSGYLAQWVEYCLAERFGGPLTNAGLQLPDAAQWQHGTLNRWFSISLPVDPRTTRTSVSVPEPATLSLLGAGLLGVWAARRRTRVADA